MSTPPAGTGFLKFNSLPPRLHITAEGANAEDDFDPDIPQYFKEEGFDVTYLPWNNGGKAYRNALAHLPDDLELGESYAVVAFGAAATDCLDHFIKPAPKLAAVICYYPPRILRPDAKYPPQMDVLVHLAGNQNFAPAFQTHYSYKGAIPGFAESDLDEFNKNAASLAWTRTLGTLRKAFQLNVELEPVKEVHTARVYAAQDAKQTVAGFGTDGPYVNHVPTMTGGIGQRDLLRFYKDYFINRAPPSLSMRLVSRTSGTNRVVDEFILSFKHTTEIPWILPGVQPTQKVVHVAMVSVVCIHGGKLYSEHVYWDQASVLVQVGLLDPKLVPEKFSKQGLKRLPVYGSETASKVLDEESQPSNGLIETWNESTGKDKTNLPARPKQAANANAGNGAAANGGGAG
ncbi:Hypothetical predicted protein [Lecanosticta acicola]|uniref:Dienelactone hydrolase n=1 Tax=Lecanosticta acicola TaxID=111012 RepID=A0AAI8Z663_9PEZI|nr:Hypothetical predicted protein [Lecanosticta acicola]